MKEFSVEVRFRNNLLLERRLALGFDQTQMAIAIGIRKTTYSLYENLRISPIKKLCAAPNCPQAVSLDIPSSLCHHHRNRHPNGVVRYRWRQAAIEIALYHDVPIETLFPRDVLNIKHNKISFIATGPEIRHLAVGATPTTITDGSLDPEISIMQHETVSELSDRIRKAITASSTIQMSRSDAEQAGRNTDVLLDHFGFNGDPLNHRQLGEKYDLSRTRIEQIIARCLRILRRPAQLNQLKPYHNGEINALPRVRPGNPR